MSNLKPIGIVLGEVLTELGRKAQLIRELQLKPPYTDWVLMNNINERMIAVYDDPVFLGK